MNATKLILLLPAVILCSVLPVAAGDLGYTQHTTYTSTHVRSKSDNQSRTAHVLGCPFVFLARATETFLHFPQIPAEAMEGDRPLVSKRGVLATREVPVEDCILSPAD